MAIRWAPLLLISSLLALPSNADVLKLGDSVAFEQSRFEDSLPTRGMSMADVEASFGRPSQAVAPVGDPPISRWLYPQFKVFFEYDRVLHAVIKREETPLE